MKRSKTEKEIVNMITDRIKGCPSIALEKILAEKPQIDNSYEITHPHRRSKEKLLYGCCIFCVLLVTTASLLFIFHPWDKPHYADSLIGEDITVEEVTNYYPYNIKVDGYSLRTSRLIRRQINSELCYLILEYISQNKIDQITIMISLNEGYSIEAANPEFGFCETLHSLNNVDLYYYVNINDEYETSGLGKFTYQDFKIYISMTYLTPADGENKIFTVDQLTTPIEKNENYRIKEQPKP